MKATTSIDNKAAVNGTDNPANSAEQISEIQNGSAEQAPGRGKPESELRAAARRHGLTLGELADKMGISYRYLSQLSTGKRPWSPAMKEKVMEVLGEVPGQGVVYRQGGYVSGETTCIRERAREMGMSMGELAEKAGVSRSFMSEVARGRRNMGVKVQQRVEALLQAPAQAGPAQKPKVDCRALWDRMEAHGWSQNETARRAGISSSLLSQVINGKRTPSGRVLRDLHGVLFQPTAAELVVPAEVKVLAWKKGGRNGVVVQGAGGPGGGTIRTGGRVPWGAEVEYAYRAGYDSTGQVSVTHLIDERGYAVMLNKPQATDSGLGVVHRGS